MEVNVPVVIPKDELVDAVRDALAERGISFQEENEWMLLTQ